MGHPESLTAFLPCNVPKECHGLGDISPLLPGQSLTKRPSHKALLSVGSAAGAAAEPQRHQPLDRLVTRSWAPGASISTLMETRSLGSSPDLLSQSCILMRCIPTSSRVAGVLKFEHSTAQEAQSREPEKIRGRQWKDG